MFPKPLIAAVMTAFVVHSGHSALWDMGTGPWASDGWGPDLDGGWPGDANHPKTPVEINTSGVEVGVHEGASLLLERPANIIIKAGAVVQDGGSFSSNFRLDVRDEYRLSGGILEGVGSFWVSQGGTFRITGGQWNIPTAELRFKAGPGTLEISNGEVHIGHVIMNKEPAAEATVEVRGSEAQLKALTFRLSGGGGQSTAKFVFDASGISGWNVMGGTGSLDLGPDDNPGNLTVDVSACPSDGSEDFILFDYTIPAALTGSFGDITVSYGSQSLSPAEGPSPKPGQFWLNTSDGAVAISFNTGGLPSPSN